MKYSFGKFGILVVLLAVFSCNDKTESISKSIIVNPLFESLDRTQTGIDFTNFIREDAFHNIFNFDYMYNGSGVAIGDINNDGLSDIYFTGNVANNKLYLNKGSLTFEDITDVAGVGSTSTWSNGTTMADVNNDGFLDIYVCRSYFNDFPENRRNQLYINNGNNTFSERAKDYGIDDIGHSTQATFFDYDNDGDLDLFIANHPENFNIRGLDRYERWKNPIPEDSNKLYRNNGNYSFTDVTEEAGLLDYAFSLGIVAQDFNEDGFMDLFVSNDYDHPDQYWINNGDGTFTNELDKSFKHISNFGMGVDAGDLNNDGLMDLITVDMLAEDNFREKTQMGSMEPEAFWVAVDWGYNYQYMRNSLHLNNGKGQFSEIGQMAGIHRTDWSWAPLIADFDNDGFKDVYITNGFRRDSRNKDIRIKNEKVLTERGGDMTAEEIIDLLEAIPSNKVQNYFFKNNNDYTFSNQSDASGLAIPSFSNGAAYGDLDNDGDLDLVVNNLLDPAFIFKNTSSEQESTNYFRLKLESTSKNRNGIGAVVTAYYGAQKQVTQVTPTRGYLSSVESTVHFGLGAASKLDSVAVVWPDQTKQVLKDISVNQTMKLRQKDSRARTKNKSQMFLFTESNIVDSSDLFKHKENEFNDYDLQILLPHKMSQFGPCIAVADVNNDGLDDFYIGGAKDQAGTMYLQSSEGFIQHLEGFWKEQSAFEDTGAHFFDADGDGDKDMYVVSGGNSLDIHNKGYSDRLLVNDGKGNFVDASHLIPEITSSGSTAISADFDLDGDLDLFVGSRHTPGAYPSNPKSFLLQNNGGRFTDISEEIEGLSNAGMITSALWLDLHNDGYPELIIAGEWMPIKIFENKQGSLKEATDSYGLSKSNGWWNSLASGDFDNDGDQDLIAGNLGLNYKYKASKEQPFHLYSQDFDVNGNLDIVLAFENEEGQFPVRGRQCSAQQIPDIQVKFPTYNEFGASDVQKIYGESLKNSRHLMVENFASSILINNNGVFELIPLPAEAQFAPVNSILVNDYTGDDKLDLLIAGNLYVSEVETGRADAGTGLLLEGNGDGTFNPIRSNESGFWADKDVKTLQSITLNNGTQHILVGNNNDALQIYQVN